MHPISFSYCIEPALGRLDYDSLSDQARMEILVGGMGPLARQPIQDANGCFLDICDWPCNTCDADGNVVRICPIKHAVQLAGTLRMDFLPQTVQHFTISMLTLTGTIETKFLPPVLEYFDIADNMFHGTLDFCTLPPALVHFRIPNNKFSGSCDLSNLPPKLRALEIDDNKFTGSLMLERLPDGLRDFDAACNLFQGPINVDNLPNTLESLLLDNNRLSGEFRFLRQPESLEELVASENQFVGNATVCRDLRVRVSLDGNAIPMVFDENGERHPFEEQILRGKSLGDLRQ